MNNILRRIRSRFGVRKHPTPCCALCQLTCCNETSFKELERAVELLRKQALAENYLGTTTDYGGQRCAYVITTPYETLLAEKLKRLGFQCKHTFERRNGYPADGLLNMWFLNI